MYTLGLNIGHESSATLLCDGRVVGCVQEERYKRIKNYSGYPRQSIKFLLSSEKISEEKIDHVAIAGTELGKEIPIDLIRHYFTNSSLLLFKIKILLAGAIKWNALKKLIFKGIKTELLIREFLYLEGFRNASIKFYDHHLCHAASAYYCSPFNKALVLTQDGKGDMSSGGVFAGDGFKLKQLVRQSELDSIGQIYAEVTRFLGFKPTRHEGKVTGLAAFGDSSKSRFLLNVLVEDIQDTVKRSKILDKINCFKDLPKLLLWKHRANDKSVLPFAMNAMKLQIWLKINLAKFSREDISAGVQQVTEEWIVRWVEKVIHKYRPHQAIPICLAGGLFANVKVNQKINDLEKVSDLFIQPAMGDCGLSLGASLYHWHMELEREKNNYSFFNPYLGQSYSTNEILNTIMSFKDRISYFEHEEIEDFIAEELIKDKIVGRFQGRAEWGPRALGNRSILISPKDKRVNDLVNLRLRRSEFMPFAPSVIDRRANDYFENKNGGEIKKNTALYMTATSNVRREKIFEIPAVVHIDDTARPQIVTKEINLSFYKILEKFEQKTGIGCLVNTSFNLHEEPIVNSPEDAIRALLEDAVDFLAIHNFIVYKK